MSDDYTNAPPPQQPTEPTATAESSGGRRWKTWHLATATIVALLLGIAMGGAGGTETDDDPTAAGNPAPAETVTVTETATVTETETVTADGEPAPAETVTVTAQPTEQAAEEPAEDGDGTYTAGSYTLTDVQVGEDSLGDFEVRARATNNGSAKQGVCLTASIFSGGSVVGTTEACVQDWAAGETRTIEMISFDDYQEWDEVEFQVDSEY